eukprot:jgi/Psemu1/40939/gm1.40939_g
MNDKDEASSTTTDAPSPTSAAGGTIINLVNSNKRQRFVSESMWTEDCTDMRPQESKKPAKRARTIKSMVNPAATPEANASLFPPSATRASFGVSISPFDRSDQNQKERMTFEELSSELCKIVDTVHYSRHEAITTLTTLCHWGYADDVVFMEELLELGGIQRVLLYLKNNIGDPTCVAMAAKTIMSCTVRSPHHNSFENAKDIVRALTKRGGVEILLQASEEYGGENMHSQLDALRWIWSALANVTDKSSAYEVGEQEEQQKRLVAVFKVGLDTMSKLGENVISARKPSPRMVVNEEDKSDTKSVESSAGNFVSYDAFGGADYQLKAIQRIFSSICGGGGSRKRTAFETAVKQSKRRIARPTKAIEVKVMHTCKAELVKENNNNALASLVMELVFATWIRINDNGLLVRDNLQGLNLFGSCIESLKRPGGFEWVGNESLMIQASKFFVQCCDKNILSTKEEFELVLPLIVDCIANFPEPSYQGGLFGFVNKAQSVVDRSLMQESGVLRAIATSLESKDVHNDIKNASPIVFIVDDFKTWKREQQFVSSSSNNNKNNNNNNNNNNRDSSPPPPTITTAIEQRFVSSSSNNNNGYSSHPPPTTTTAIRLLLQQQRRFVSSIQQRIRPLIQQSSDSSPPPPTTTTTTTTTTGICLILQQQQPQFVSSSNNNNGDSFPPPPTTPAIRLLQQQQWGLVSSSNNNSNSSPP